MDVQALVGTTGAGTAAGAGSAPAPSTPVAAPQAASTTTPHVLGEPAKKTPGIASVVAKIFHSGGDDAKSAALSVSYKIHNHEILTVFTDPTTGQEIAQFPPDLLGHLSSFFDQTQGATLDENA